jgi:signal transduction histidine kinase
LKRFFKSKILLKGMAFILIPCTIDTIFCVQLLHLMAETDKASKQEHKHMEIVRHANNLMQFYAAASGQYGSFATSGNKNFLASGAEYEKKLDVEYNKLMPMIIDMPGIAKSTRLYRDQGQEMLKNFKQLGTMQGINDMTGAATILRARGIKDFIYQAGNTSKTITDLAFAQEEDLERVRLQQVARRQNIVDLLQQLIVFNLLLALIMGSLFLFDITRRLGILVENAQLLPKNMPLNKRVTGNDELSYLDSVLHEAAGELRNSADQRRYLMEMVSHDIRSPLMSAQVSLEVLSDKRIGELPPMATRQVEALGANLRRVISLTSDLMEVDKLEVENLELDRQLVDIWDFVEENLVGLAELAKKKDITLVNECAHIKIMADKLRLGQVVTNIVSNAIKFSPEHSWIRVQASRNESYLNLSIVDNGPGIPKKHQQRIFEKYAQLENGAGKGFGLGLAICKLVVQAHDGAIGVTNEAGAGARFWVRLPLPKQTGRDGQDGDDEGEAET